MPIQLDRRTVLAALGGSSGLAALGLDSNALGSGADTTGTDADSVPGHVWVGPRSERSDVSPQDGMVYVATDENVLYFGDGGSWESLDVGSEEQPVSNVHAKSVQTDAVRTKHDITGRELSLREYGADPSGDTASDHALDAAVSDANLGDRIVFREGDFLLETEHTYHKSVRFVGENATIIDGRDTPDHTGADLIYLRSDETGSSTGLTTDAPKGADTLSVSDASIFSDGQLVFVDDDATGSYEDRHVEYLYVETADESANELSLHGFTRHNFRADSAEVIEADLLDRPGFINLDVEDCPTDGGCLGFRSAKHPVFRNCTHDSPYRSSFYALWCYKPKWTNCTATNSQAYEGGEGEPYRVNGCTDAYLESCESHDCRRGIDATGGTAGITIVDPVIRGYTHRGIAMHGHDIADQTVIGGVIQGQQGETGVCIDDVDYATGMRVFGTELHPAREAINPNGAMTVSDVDIHVPPNHGGSGSGVIDISASNVQISNTSIIVPDLSNNIRAVMVSNSNGDVSNVDIDVDIEVEGVSRDSGNSVELVGVKARSADLLRNVDLDLDIRGNGVFGDDYAVRIDGDAATLEDIDITGGIYGVGGYGVVIRCDTGISGARVHDCDIESGESAVYINDYDDFTDVCEDIWVKDNNLTSSNGPEIDLAEPTLDRAWVVDNRAASVSVNSNATNVERRGNQ